MNSLELVGARVESHSIPKDSLLALQKRMPGKVGEHAFSTEHARYTDSTRQDRIKLTQLWLSKLDVPPDKVVVLLWSGGLDSTALLGHLLGNNYTVIPVYLASRHGGYLIRELAAVKQLWELINARYHGTGFEMFYPHLAPIWYFDLVELMKRHQTRPDLVPDRNKLFTEFVIEAIMDPLGIATLGVGEYTGAEHWVVNWHVPSSDCVPTSFAKWVGPSRKFICLDDTGSYCAVKGERLDIGINALGVELMGKTTCCLSDTMRECGMCYGCVQRAAAWDYLHTPDPTNYIVDPRKHWLYECYVSQHNEVVEAR